MTDRYARMKVQRQRERQSVKAADLVRLINFLQPKDFEWPPEHVETLRSAVTETARKALIMSNAAAIAWDKAEQEASRQKYAGTEPPTPDTRPRDPVHNEPVAITPKATTGQGKMYPHPLKGD